MTALLVPPLSKSDAQRALILGDIVGVPVKIDASEIATLPRDVQVLMSGLDALHSQSGEVIEIDCRDGGAPFRFLLTQACVLPSRHVRFTGSQRLGARPHGPLLASLRGALGESGLRMTEGNPWPIEVVTSKQRIETIQFEVTSVESSQFASSLLLGAARVAFSSRKACSIHLQGAMTSEGYFEMTKSWVLRAGFDVEASGTAVTVRWGGQPKTLVIPGDFSSLTYLLALAWRSGATVDRVDFDAAHPDKAFIRHLEAVGLSVSRSKPVRVTGTARTGFSVDAEACPDAVPTLAVVATVLPVPSIVTRVGILRHKESDRLAACVDLLQRAGHRATVLGDTLTIDPGTPRDFEFDARDDHRMAMSAAVLAYLSNVTVRLKGRESVEKSFPAFWNEFFKVAPRNCVEESSIL